MQTSVKRHAACRKHIHSSHFCSILKETTAMEGIQAALRILSQELDRTDGTEGVDAALDVLRALPMTQSDSLKKARKVRARLAQRRDSKKVKKKLEKYNKTIVRKREKLETLCGHVKTVRLKVSEYKKWTPTAFLKVCFTANSGSMSATRGASRMRRTRGTPPNASLKKRSNPQARATSAAADHCNSSSLYVQQIRNALANLILEVQSRSLDSIGHYENAVLEILLDETELKISQRKVIQCFWRHRKQKKVVHVNTVVPALAVHGSI